MQLCRSGAVLGDHESMLLRGQQINDSATVPTIAVREIMVDMLTSDEARSRAAIFLDKEMLHFRAVLIGKGGTAGNAVVAATGHHLQEVSVDGCNFKSVMASMSAHKSATCVTFLKVRTTGPLKVEQLRELLEAVADAVFLRVVFEESAELWRTLCSGDMLSQVLKTAALRERYTSGDAVDRVLYDRASAAGSLVLNLWQACCSATPDEDDVEEHQQDSIASVTFLHTLVEQVVDARKTCLHALPTKNWQAKARDWLNDDSAKPIFVLQMADESSWTGHGRDGAQLQERAGARSFVEGELKLRVMDAAKEEDRALLMNQRKRTKWLRSELKKGVDESAAFALCNAERLAAGQEESAMDQMKIAAVAINSCVAEQGIRILLVDYTTNRNCIWHHTKLGVHRLACISRVRCEILLPTQLPLSGSSHSLHSVNTVTPAQLPRSTGATSTSSSVTASYHSFLNDKRSAGATSADRSVSSTEFAFVIWLVFGVCTPDVLAGVETLLEDLRGSRTTGDQLVRMVDKFHKEYLGGTAEHVCEIKQATTSCSSSPYGAVDGEQGEAEEAPPRDAQQELLLTALALVGALPIPNPGHSCSLAKRVVDVARALLASEKLSAPGGNIARVAASSLMLDVPTFAEFMTWPVPRLLPQAARRALWLLCLHRWAGIQETDVESSDLLRHYPSSNVHSQHIFDLSGVDATTDKLEEPKYAIPKGLEGRGTREIEQYRRQAERGEDFHYEKFASNWKIDFDLSNEALFELLLVSPDRLKLVLCLSPAYITRMGDALHKGKLHTNTGTPSGQPLVSSSCTSNPNVSVRSEHLRVQEAALEALRKDVEDVRSLVERDGLGAPRDDSPARKAWVAIKWLLWKQSFTEADCDSVSKDDISTLVGERLQLSVHRIAPAITRDSLPMPAVEGGDRPDIERGHEATFSEDDDTSGGDLLLLTVARLIMQLDEPPHIIANQSQIQGLLLGTEGTGVRLDSSTFQSRENDEPRGLFAGDPWVYADREAAAAGRGVWIVGAAFLDFLYSTSTAEAMAKEGSGRELCAIPMVADLLRLKRGENLLLPKDTSSSRSPIPEFTPAAVCCLLRAARNTNTLAAVCELLRCSLAYDSSRRSQTDSTTTRLQRLMGTSAAGQKSGQADAEERAVIHLRESLLQTWMKDEALLVPFLVEIKDWPEVRTISSQADSSSPGTSTDHKSLLAKLLAKLLIPLTIPNATLRDYIACAEKATNRGMKTSLDLSASERLLMAYVEACREDGDTLEIQYQVGRHNKLLSDSACRSILDGGFACRSEAPRLGERVLFYHCWGRCPIYSFPDSMLPSDPEKSLLFVLQNLPPGTPSFTQRCRETRALSLMGNFLTRPETLNLAVYNTLCDKWTKAGANFWRRIEEETLVIAQEGHKDYPAYYLQWHYRPLPAAQLTALQKSVRSQHRCARESKRDGAASVCPRVSEGVNADTVKHNLETLLHLAGEEGELSNEDCLAQRKLNGFAVAVWFVAAGFKKDTLERCVDPSSRPAFEKAWASLSENLRNNRGGINKTAVLGMKKQFVFAPMPKIIDVAARGSTSRTCAQLFGANEDSAVATCERLNTLSEHLKLARPALELADFWDSKSRTAGPKLGTELKAFADAVGRRLQKDVEPVKEKSEGPVQYRNYINKELQVNQLFQLYAVLADFTSALNAGDAVTFLQRLISSFDAANSPPHSSWRQQSTAQSDKKNERDGILLYLLFLLYNITVDSDGREMRVIVEAFQKRRMAVCDKVKQELTWLKEHYYGGKKENSASMSDSERNALENVEAMLGLGCFKNPYTLHLRRDAEAKHMADIFYTAFVQGDISTSWMPPSYVDRPFLQRGAKKIVGRVDDSAPKAVTSNRQGVRAVAFEVHDAEEDAIGSPGATNRNGGVCGNQSRFFEEYSSGSAKSSTLLRGRSRIMHSDRAGQFAGELSSRFGSSPLIQCRDLFEIKNSKNMFEHATLQVRPALGQVLVYDKQAGARGADSQYYRLAPVTTTLGQGEVVERVFANSGDAFNFLTSLSGAPVLIADGFHYVKSPLSDSWVLLFPDRELAAGKFSGLCHFLYSHQLHGVTLRPDIQHALYLLALSVMDDMCRKGHLRRLRRLSQAQDDADVLDAADGQPPNAQPDPDEDATASCTPGAATVASLGGNTRIRLDLQNTQQEAHAALQEMMDLFWSVQMRGGGGNTSETLQEVFSSLQELEMQNCRALRRICKTLQEQKGGQNVQPLVQRAFRKMGFFVDLDTGGELGACTPRGGSDASPVKLQKQTSKGMHAAEESGLEDSDDLALYDTKLKKSAEEQQVENIEQQDHAGASSGGRLTDKGTLLAGVLCDVLRPTDSAHEMKTQLEPVLSRLVAPFLHQDKRQTARANNDDHTHRGSGFGGETDPQAGGGACAASIRMGSLDLALVPRQEITTKKFALRGCKILEDILRYESGGASQSQRDARTSLEPAEKKRRLSKDQEGSRSFLVSQFPACTQASDGSDHRGSPAPTAASPSAVLPDLAIDRRRDRGALLFPQDELGYGQPVNSPLSVLSLDPPWAAGSSSISLYFSRVEHERHDLRYSESRGQEAGYLFPRQLLAPYLRQAKLEAHGSTEQPTGDGNFFGGSATACVLLVRSVDGDAVMLTRRSELLEWLSAVLRSPLAPDVKAWILETTSRPDAPRPNPQKSDPAHITQALIMACLMKRCPTGISTSGGKELRQSFEDAMRFENDKVLDFVRRKSQQFGVYVCCPGTLREMRVLGIRNIAVLDYAEGAGSFHGDGPGQRGAATRSRDRDNARYLEIVSKFSDFCMFVYVRNLTRVSDVLLKWVAEHTKNNPWRFVYFESADVSHNVSENRDRCEMTFAPSNATRDVESVDDLDKAEVVTMRPSHAIHYAGDDPRAEQFAQRGPEQLISYFEDEFPDRDKVDLTNRSDLLGDFGDIMRDALLSPDPAKRVPVVMLVSPPGTGKTHFMLDLRSELEAVPGSRVTLFDASSPELVKHSLASLLQKATQIASGTGAASALARNCSRQGLVTPQAGGGGAAFFKHQTARSILIVDEYHFLSEEQKESLFDWLQAEALGALTTVLIANRIDSRDRNRMRELEESRHLLLDTHLTEQKVEEVMDSRHIEDARLREAILLWFRTSRLLFGDESVSLRLVTDFEALLRNPPSAEALQERCESLLTQKVPTISSRSVSSFVRMFLGRTGHLTQEQPRTATELLFEIARAVPVPTGGEKDLRTIPEFLDSSVCLYNSPPATRLAAWAAYALRFVSEAGRRSVGNLSALFAGVAFVDQVGFPFELAAVGTGHAEGKAFSWGGDEADLEEVIAALQRGHSMDWAEHGRRGLLSITNPESYCRLLSASRTQSEVLKNTDTDTLLTLLAAPLVCYVEELASIILKYTVTAPKNTPEVFATAAWAWFRLKKDVKAIDVLHLLDPKFLRPSANTVAAPNSFLSLLWAQGNAFHLGHAVKAAEKDAVMRELLQFLAADPSLPPADAARLFCGRYAMFLHAPQHPVDKPPQQSSAIANTTHTAEAAFIATQGAAATLTAHFETLGHGHDSCSRPQADRRGRADQGEDAGLVHADPHQRSQVLSCSPPSELEKIHPFTPDTFRTILLHSSDCEPAWCEEARHLWHVVHGKAIPSHVDSLWAKGKQHLLLASTCTGEIDTRVAAGLLKLQGALRDDVADHLLKYPTRIGVSAEVVRERLGNTLRLWAQRGSTREMVRAVFSDDGAKLEVARCFEAAASPAAFADASLAPQPPQPPAAVSKDAPAARGTNITQRASHEGPPPAVLAAEADTTALPPQPAGLSDVAEEVPGTTDAHAAAAVAVLDADVIMSTAQEQVQPDAEDNAHEGAPAIPVAEAGAGPHEGAA
ncbi:unnamed protein product [Amoebophrya sp. A25]|nr:unnamed protein product [Amoebophrya sp. A25]|eukprot:GSA25T00002829001.1